MHLQIHFPQSLLRRIINNRNEHFGPLNYKNNRRLEDFPTYGMLESEMNMPYASNDLYSHLLSRHVGIPTEEISKMNIFIQPSVPLPQKGKLYALMASRTTRAMHNKTNLHVETIVDGPKDENSSLADSEIGHNDSPRESPDYLKTESLIEGLPDLTHQFLYK
jgi:hypothetical protein